MGSPKPRGELRVFLALLACLSCTGSGRETPTPSARDYLYLWTASADSAQPDFLAVLDVTEDSGRYGRLVTTLPVPGRGNVPHHTEHVMSADGHLFANGYASGRTFVFDLRSPEAPKLAAEFGDVEGLSHPHSYLRLPNGNVLATFQMTHKGEHVRNGGLVELTSAGQVVRSAFADRPGADTGLRVYSAGIVPSLDRVVTTTTDMEKDFRASRSIQVWRLSDLSLLNTFTLPDGPAGDEGFLTAEPRLMADGKTVLVSTFSCGLYLMDGLAGEKPTARLVSSFPRRQGTACAIPAIVGRYYLVTVPAWSAVVSLDISNPASPREVSRASFDSTDVPHWISVSPDTRRLVVTGYASMQHRVMILQFDSTTGRLSVDERFREEGTTTAGYRMDNKTWPHGGSAKAIPHGAVFSRRD